MWDRLIALSAIWTTAVLGSEVTAAKRQIRDVEKMLVMCAWTKQVNVDGAWMPVASTWLAAPRPPRVFRCPNRTCFSDTRTS